METEQIAKNIRIHALRMTSLGGSSHIGSVFSIADILSVLYSRIMKVDSENPDWPDRDRFILSKGHAGAGVYAVLAECGFISVDQLQTHYQDGSKLSGHVSHKGIPGVELSTGSLGHGLGVGVGMAKAIKMDEGSQKVYVLMSDGEFDEGSVWEAILFAQHHKLDNLIAIVDYNKIQSLAKVSETIDLEPFSQKLEAFNWRVLETDGHDHNSLYLALESARENIGRPTLIIAHTIKGKGVSFMENTILWHYRCAKGDEFKEAMKELEEI